MSLGPSAGSKLFIANPGTSPTSYTEIGEIANIGEFGRVYGEVTATSLGNRAIRKYKTDYNDGNLTLLLNKDPDDAGQDLLDTALASDEDYNFRVTLNDDVDGKTVPTEIVFKAKVMGKTTNVGGTANVVQSSVTLSLKSGSINQVDAY